MPNTSTPEHLTTAERATLQTLHKLCFAAAAAQYVDGLPFGELLRGTGLAHGELRAALAGVVALGLAESVDRWPPGVSHVVRNMERARRMARFGGRWPLTEKVKAWKLTGEGLAAVRGWASESGASSAPAADAKPAPPAPRADVPDAKGYVAAPVDPAAYVSASVIVAEHCEELGAIIPTVRELGRVLENFGETGVRWTRPRTRSGEPDKRRRLVHLGDWTAYRDRYFGRDADGEPKRNQAGSGARRDAIRAANLG